MLTDHQIAMIEQLTYLDKSVAEAAGIGDKFQGITGSHEGRSIGEILAQFDENALERLANTKIEGAHTSGAEWASIIKYLQSNQNISGLILSDRMVTNGKTLALAFYSKDNPEEAIVAFKGTTGGDEWVDNVEGLNVADTKAQREALDFIESLRFGSITVTGHSKGGNKAMYVSILSDKVNRCVAYDGQGFSQEFLDKYWAEIQAKAGIIKLYSVSTDFVNILMFPIPGAELIFVEGYGIDGIGEHHAPNSFFVTDANGNLILDSNGNPQMVFISQDESMKMIHEFTVFVMNLADANDKKMLVEFVSELLAMMFSEPTATPEEIMDFALSNPESIELILAYLIKYMDTYDLGASDVYKLLETLGLTGLDSMFTFSALGVEIDGLAALLEFAKGQLTDGKTDHILELLLSFVDFGGINEKDFWRGVEGKINKIGNVNRESANQNATSKAGVIRNFSKNAYNALLNTMTQFENSGFESVSSWSNYSSEDWYSSLFIGIAIKGINTYMNKLSDTNSKCRTRIDAVFNNVSQVDSQYGNKVNNHNIYLRGVKTTIEGIANSIA